MKLFITTLFGLRHSRYYPSFFFKLEAFSLKQYWARNKCSSASALSSQCQADPTSAREWKAGVATAGSIWRTARAGKTPSTSLLHGRTGLKTLLNLPVMDSTTPDKRTSWLATPAECDFRGGKKRMMHLHVILNRALTARIFVRITWDRFYNTAKRSSLYFARRRID